MSHIVVAAATGLTVQELKVASLIADGHTNRSIGYQLDIAPNTVARHVQHAFDKLGIHTRLELALWHIKNHPNSLQLS